MRPKFIFLFLIVFSSLSLVITDRDQLSNRLDELEQIRAEQRENEEDSPTPSSEDSVISASASSSDQSSSSSLGEHQPADANKSVEDMDLSNDDQNNDNAEHLEQKNLDEENEDSSPAELPTKMVHSRSEGDLSLEEERAKAYNQKNQENNNHGAGGGGITSSESYNNFLYWREPLPVLDDIPDVDAIDNNDEKSNTEKESESKDDETPSTSSEGEDDAKDEQKGNDSIYVRELGKGRPEFVLFFLLLEFVLFLF